MELSSPAAEPAPALAAQDDNGKERGTGLCSGGRRAVAVPRGEPGCRGSEVQPQSRVVPTQVPKALGWAVHQ